MSDTTKKRTLDAFFKRPPKKVKVSDDQPASDSVSVKIGERPSISLIYSRNMNSQAMQHIHSRYHTFPAPSQAL